MSDQLFRVSGKKISEFLSNSTIPLNAELTFILNNTNFRITFQDFLSFLNVTGTIDTVGEGTQILQTPVVGANLIRALEAVAGVKVEVSITNGIKISSDFQDGDPSSSQILVNKETNPLIKGLKASLPLSISESGDFLQLNISDVPIPTDTIIVNQLTDLPAPVSNVITLSPATVYLFSSPVDISPNTLLLSDTTVVTSSGAFANTISSDTTGALFNTTVDGEYAIRTVGVSVPNGSVFNFSATNPLGAFVGITSMVIRSAQNLGSVNNTSLSMILVNSLAILPTNPLTISGIGNALNLDTWLINDFTGTLIDFGSSVSNLINIENLNIVTTTPANILFDGLPNSGNLSATGHGTIRAISIIGSHTPSINILPSDLRWHFNDNVGIENSYNTALVSLPINTAETTFGGINVPSMIVGTWSPQTSSRFTTTAGGRTTYIGIDPVRVDIDVTLNAAKAGGANVDYTFRLAKNGTPIPEAKIQKNLGTSIDNISISFSVDLVTSNFFDVFVENNMNTDNIIISSANIRSRAYS